MVWVDEPRSESVRQGRGAAGQGRAHARPPRHPRPHGPRGPGGRLRGRARDGRQHRPAGHGHDAQHGLRAGPGAPDRLDRSLRARAGPPLRGGGAERQPGDRAHRGAPRGTARRPPTPPPARGGGEAGPSVSRATVRIEEHPWERLGDHEHAFQRGAGGRRVCTVASDGAVSAGIEDLLVLKTTQSGWEGFERERFTTLPDTDDRILCTIVTTSWDYDGPVDYDAAWTGARDAILRAFGDHYSPSVQFTLNRLGEAVLASCDAVARARFALPNRHHLLFDLARFGIENDREIFQATTEPYGLIEGTVERDGTPA